MEHINLQIAELSLKNFLSQIFQRMDVIEFIGFFVLDKTKETK